MTETKPYGSWISSLTAEKLADKGVRYGHMCVDGDDVYWLESRAKEKGRNVLVSCNSNGDIFEPLPSNYSVQSKVHEYGSGDFLVVDKIIYFSNAADQCVYRFNSEEVGSVPQRLTPTSSVREDRYADYCLSINKNYLICVRERHEEKIVINELVSINLTPTSLPEKRPDNNQDLEKQFEFASVKIIQSGFGFYTYPRMSNKGDKICWTCWNQPDMPWDAAELWVADFHQNGTLDAVHKVVGGNNNVELEREQEEEISPGQIEHSKTGNTSAIYQPCWSSNDLLHYISDASGWTNIYSHTDGLLNALAPIDREFGIPQWSLASSTYAVAPDGNVYAVYVQKGSQFLCKIDINSGTIEPLSVPFKDFGEHLLLSGDNLYFKAASPEIGEAIYRYDLKTSQFVRLSAASKFPLDTKELSIAQSIEFLSTNDRISYAFYYQPHNTQYCPDENTAPPLIVMSHGGPTGMTNASLNAAIQFWTHRGFAVVDVNYAGSTGYGNQYRNLLKGNWGIVDVEDCIAAAKYLVAEGKADKNALLIRGGSAGGYTTLCALTFHDVFTAGCSRYGVADLESLSSDSHKFEARYLDSCVGPYPETKKRYQARSPVHHTEQLSCPILLLQGKDDKVVPPNQAEMMVNALKEKGIPYAYRLYEGEGHGFRKASTIVDALNSELSFYRQVLNIDDSESEKPITIIG